MNGAPINVADLPLVLTVEEAGKVLRIGRSSAYEAARTGQLPTVRIGRILRVPRSVIEEMLRVPD
jgi:excisionase family DNA binding protein